MKISLKKNLGRISLKGEIEDYRCHRLRNNEGKSVIFFVLFGLFTDPLALRRIYVKIGEHK